MPSKILGALFGRDRHTTPVDYEIPEGYTGWVTIQYGVPGAPALPKEEGTYIARIPPDGHLKTSTPQEQGIVHRRYFFVDAQGRRTPIEDTVLTDYESKAAYVAHATAVATGAHTGTKTVDGVEQLYSGFYIGKGPAGDPPAWPS